MKNINYIKHLTLFFVSVFSVRDEKKFARNQHNIFSGSLKGYFLLLLSAKSFLSTQIYNKLFL